ncbi:MAG: hypothetical protein RBT36_04490 [Desulfobulbus sp.]|jgi:glycine cleavage system regulatory protein|nr:hypothetical protein [Desulfobulbus sp.]
MSALKNCLNRHRQSGQTMRTIKMRAHLNADALFVNIRKDFDEVCDHRAANASIPLGVRFSKK